MSDRDANREQSIVRPDAPKPRSRSDWLWLGPLLLLALFLWWVSQPDPNRPAGQKTGNLWDSLLIIGLALVLFLALLLLIVAWFSFYKKKDTNEHWLLTGIVVVGFVGALVTWWFRRDFAGIVVFVMAVLLAFVFQVFSPFWYHLRSGRYLMNLGRFAEADGHLQKAWRHAQRYAATDLRRGSILTLLGDWHRQQYLLDRSEEYYQLALHILAERHQKHFAELLQTLNNLAVVYLEQGKYIEAEIYFRQANSLTKDQYKDTGFMVALTEQNLAAALVELENYGEAETLLQSAERKCGDSVDVRLLCLGRLMKLYLRTNNLARAQNCLAQALAQLEKSPADIRLSVLAPLAEVCLRQGKPDDAEQHALKALEIAEKPESKFPSSRVRALTNLAAVYLAKGQLADAEPLFRQALALHDQNDLPDNLDWAESLEQFVQLLRRTGQDAEAASWESKVQDLRRYWREYQTVPRFKDERIQASS